MRGSVNLVCGGQPKMMNANQFVVVMGMLKNVREGAAVPAALPEACEELLESGKKAKEPAPKPAPKPAKKPAKAASEEDEVDYTMDKAVFSALKKRFQKETEGEETMAPALAIKLFKKSGVPEEDVVGAMDALRHAVDEAELLVANDYWPYPSYGRLLFGVK